MHRAQLVAVVVALALVGGAYAIYQTKGSTTVGVTITTNPDLERGLVVHWSFDGSYVDLSQASAEIRDSSTSGNHGNWLNHASTTVAGPVGQAVRFDGVNDTIAIGTMQSIRSNATFCTWIKVLSYPGSQTILMKGRSPSDADTECMWSVDSSGRQTFWDYDSGYGFSGVFSDTSVADGNWHHICFRKEFPSGTFFIDGRPDGTGTAILDALYSENDLVVGGDTRDFVNYFRGALDDVRVYTRALSGDDIKRLYQLGNTTRVAETIDTNPDLNRGLVGHWTFDGADVDWGSTTAEIKDRSGNNNHGNASSTMSTYKSATPGVLGQALKFSTTTSDFVSDYVEVADSDSISFTAGGGVDKPFSVGGWVYMNYTGSPTYSPAFVAKTFGGNNEWSLESQMGGVYTIRTFDGPSPDWIGRTYSGVNLVQAYRNQWVHLFATYDGSMNAAGFRLYLNGLRVDNSNDINTTYDGIPQSAAAVRLGNGFAGKLDDVRIYNRALSAEEVKRLYELGEGTRVNMTLSSPTLDSGLVGHWTFDGADVDWGSTTAEIKDTSGQGNHGNAQGSMSAQLSPTPGMMGQGMKYNGTTDYVTAPASTANFGSGAFSAFMWLRSNEDTNEAALLGNNQYGVPGGWLLFRPAGGTIRINLDAGFTQYLTGTTNVFNDQWHFVGVSRTAGGRYDLWVDGVSQANTNAAVYDVNTSNSLHFMTQFDQASRSVRGTIDDVRVYNRVLSADEVKRLYDMGR